MGEWADIKISDRDVAHVATFFQIREDEARKRLESYRLEHFAAAWKKANPKTEQDIRRFYAETDLYVWELTNWHSSSEYRFYRDLLETLASIAPPHTHPRLLDYGSGIGTAASLMAARGYQVSIADVPGKTFEYAQHRLRREAHEIKAIPIESSQPPRLGSFDVIVCFDVLEHVPNPDRVLHSLSRALRKGGYAAIVATFYDPSGHHPHHLEENIKKFGNKRVWNMVVEANGLRAVKPNVYVRKGNLMTLGRKLRYRIWQKTGYQLRSPVARVD